MLEVVQLSHLDISLASEWPLWWQLIGGVVELLSIPFRLALGPHCNQHYAPTLGHLTEVVLSPSPYFELREAPALNKVRLEIVWRSHSWPIVPAARLAIGRTKSVSPFQPLRAVADALLPCRPLQDCVRVPCPVPVTFLAPPRDWSRHLSVLIIPDVFHFLQPLRPSIRR